MNEPVAYGIGEFWIAEHVAPAIDRRLACDKRRCVIEAILDDFEQIPGLLRSMGLRPPIVEDRARAGSDE